MPLDYEVPDYKKIRVIVDTDAACEADDPFAIAHALMSPKLIVKAVLAEHFAQPGSARRSLDEIRTVLDAMGSGVPALMGEEGPLAEKPGGATSEASEFLIREALSADEKPLYALCLGAITNVASAIRRAPEIAGKMRIVWIGGHAHDVKEPPFREFNAGNDIRAANAVLSSGADIWQIPSNVYGAMRIGIAEIRKRIAPCGKIGRHLYENLVNYNNSPGAGWTPGESWSLGDSPAVGVALDQNCGRYAVREAPVIMDDTSNAFESGRPLIRVYESIDSRFILEDFIAKLELLYGE